MSAPADASDGDLDTDTGVAPARRRLAGRAPTRGHTITATIYRDLRAAIVATSRRPGDPVFEKQIAEQYGVSRTPVREAILRLADEGLIEIFPQSGTFVARIPVETLPEAIVIREVLEVAAVRRAAVRAGRVHVARLHANLEQQREAVETDDLDGFHEGDEALHALIAETAGYPGFWTVTRQVKIQVDRYRRLTLPVPGRAAETLAEHEAIVAAIAANDPERAERAMTSHLGRLSARIGEAQGNAPQYFISTPPAADRRAG